MSRSWAKKGSQDSTYRVTLITSYKFQTNKLFWIHPKSWSTLSCFGYHIKKNVELEIAQKKTRVTESLENVTYGEEKKELGWFSLEKWRLSREYDIILMGKVFIKKTVVSCSPYSLNNKKYA